MRLEAPYDVPDTIVSLPNPIFDDSRALDIELQHHQTIDATRYTYIKQTDNLQLVFTWEFLGRGKMLELEEFLQAYAGEFIRIQDHNNKIWKASLTTGPKEFITSTLSKNAGGPRTESGQVTLEFIGCLKG